MTHGEASLTRRTTPYSSYPEAYEVTCAAGLGLCRDTLEVATEAFRASEEVLVRELRVERAAVDVAVVDITGAPIPSVSIGGAVITDGRCPMMPLRATNHRRGLPRGVLDSVAT